MVKRKEYNETVLVFKWRKEEEGQIKSMCHEMSLGQVCCHLPVY